MTAWRRGITAGVAACVSCGLGSSAAVAHEMNVAALVRGDDLVVEVRYEDGSIPAAARVIVVDDARVEIRRMSTDARGEASVPLAAIRNGAIVQASDDDGHATYRVLTPADLAQMPRE